MRAHRRVPTRVITEAQARVEGKGGGPEERKEGRASQVAGQRGGRVDGPTSQGRTDRASTSGPTTAPPRALGASPRSEGTRVSPGVSEQCETRVTSDPEEGPVTAPWRARRPRHGPRERGRSLTTGCGWAATGSRSSWGTSTSGSRSTDPGESSGFSKANVGTVRHSVVQCYSALRREMGRNDSGLAARDGRRARPTPPDVSVVVRGCSVGGSDRREVGSTRERRPAGCPPPGRNDVGEQRRGGGPLRRTDRHGSAS